MQNYKDLFDGSGNGPGEKTLEDKFFEQEVDYQFEPLKMCNLILRSGLIEMII